MYMSRSTRKQSADDWRGQRAKDAEEEAEAEAAAAADLGVLILEVGESGQVLVKVGHAARVEVGELASRCASDLLELVLRVLLRALRLQPYTSIYSYKDTVQQYAASWTSALT